MKREFFGSDINEALEKAVQSLGIDADHLRYHVIEQEIGTLAKGKKRAIVVEVEEGTKNQEVSRDINSELHTKKKEMGDVEWAKYFCEGIFGGQGEQGLLSQCTCDFPEGCKAHFGRSGVCRRRQ